MMEAAQTNDSTAIAKIRESGLQVTYQRLAIYEALCKATEHPTAEVICKEVRKRFPIISLGTVYKTLERFHAAGLIKKVNPVNETARYEAKTALHHHMICEKCQSIHDIHELSGTIPFPEKPGFRITRYQVIFHGCCENCADK
jgi:Fur family transcriptional regulator, peroxide stress response regulator